jgi:hypothetical protein
MVYPLRLTVMLGAPMTKAESTDVLLHSRLEWSVMLAVSTVPQVSGSGAADGGAADAVPVRPRTPSATVRAPVNDFSLIP